MLIDANVNLGPWPFNLVPGLTASGLASRLRANGIGRAIVSPTPAILAPDPAPANRALLAAVRGVPSLLPLPVVNPALRNWREQLDAAAAGPLRAAKLHPNYHNYRLESPRLDAFFEAAHSGRIRLVVSARLEDDRHRYFGLRVTMVPAASVAAFLGRHPRLHPLVLGLGLPEIRKIAPERDNFSVDTSFIEWRNALSDLIRKFPARRIFFGSHTPFFVTRSGVDQLAASRLPARAAAAIGGGNAARFFDL
jgi:predicted TIM-barrel fold metal-dependent hydrolase